MLENLSSLHQLPFLQIYRYSYRYTSPLFLQKVGTGTVSVPEHGIFVLLAMQNKELNQTFFYCYMFLSI
jgi:hypothetical protein